MKPIRSFLFVPAIRESWIDKVPGYGADAVILDLEDSVPEDAKAQAREIARGRIGPLARAGQRVHVRINRSPFLYSFEDILAVVTEGLEGIVLPKPEGPEDIDTVSAMLAEAELRNGRPIGGTLLVATLESARSIQFAYEIARRERVGMIAGVSARNGDVQRSVGYQWTPEGMESLHLKSAAVIAARAAGKLPLGGLWQDIRDLEGLRRAARKHRELGFVGEFVLHPSNVPVVNEAYSPSVEELAYYEGMVRAYDEAVRAGRGAIIYQGEHIDLAHVRTAREIVALARGTTQTSDHVTGASR